MTKLKTLVALLALTTTAQAEVLTNPVATPKWATLFAESMDAEKAHDFAAMTVALRDCGTIPGMVVNTDAVWVAKIISSYTKPFVAALSDEAKGGMRAGFEYLNEQAEPFDQLDPDEALVMACHSYASVYSSVMYFEGVK